MEVLLFLGGVIVGCLLTLFVYNRKTAYGYFVLDPVSDPDDPDKHSLGIKLNTPIEGTNRIILTKHKSQ